MSISSRIELAYRVEEFEAAVARDPSADFTPFLPEPGHKHYDAILLELMCVDLERSWSNQTPRRLADYLARFPAVGSTRSLLAVIAYEEYRQRALHGEAVSPVEYETRYGVDTRDWEIESETGAGVATARIAVAVTPTTIIPPGGLNRRDDSLLPMTNEVVDPELRNALERAAQTWPEPGSEFLGFQIVRELGRGAFARVYLARQGELGRRYVALKIACDIATESVTLAQLQHTNIVPIYSFHRSGRYQAVCMPYFGQATLAQVLQNLNGGRTLPAHGRDLRSTVLAHSFSARSLSSASGQSKSSRNGEQPADASHAVPGAQEMPPYTGLSLEAWTRLEGLSYIEAILTLSMQLADGLAHAHARGILHRDLKPANILFTDEGRPMLLDFNLAEDMNSRGTADRAAVGGTLPYMSPEHLEAFGRSGRLDVRSDLYSFGVILFELLTGRHPFPLRKGPIAERLLLLHQDRLLLPPSVRESNPAVSPAVDAMVRKCLMPNPDDRYQQALDLREDIELHLNHQPLKHGPNPSRHERLRKWMKRHPRLASSGSVAALAAAVILALGISAWYIRDQSRNFQARSTFTDHQAAFADAQLFLDDRHQSQADLDGALSKLRGVLERYGLRDNTASGDWQQSVNVARLAPADRERILADVGETYYLMSQIAYLKAVACDHTSLRNERIQEGENWNALAKHYAGDRLKRAVSEQRAAFAELAGDAATAKAAREEAVATEVESARDIFLRGMLHAQKNQHRDAIAHLERSTLLDPQNFSAWFVLGTSYLNAGQPGRAEACFGACLAIRDDFMPAWLNRGLAFSSSRRFAQAIGDFDRVISLAPNNPAGYLIRAEAEEALGKHTEAEADYGRALDTGTSVVRTLLQRAYFRDRRGDTKGAAADRALAMKTTPTDERCWQLRAETRSDSEPEAALADIEQALKLNPFSASALQMKAYLLGERLQRPAEAMTTLNRGIELHPEHIQLRSGRGVLLARKGLRKEALADAKISISLDRSPANAYQVACIHALCSKNHPEDQKLALDLLWTALKPGFGLDIIDGDHDLDSLRGMPAFKQLLGEAKAINKPRE